MPLHESHRLSAWTPNPKAPERQVRLCTVCYAAEERAPTFLGFHGHDCALEYPCGQAPPWCRPRIPKPEERKRGKK
jgi:hypothetical protein